MKLQITDEHLEYLDKLEEAGQLNMFRAGVFLKIEFPELSRTEIREIIKDWKRTYNRRHPDIKTTIEWCPHCDLEVTVPNDRPSACPSCGNVILPCSTCPREIPTECDWTQEHRCSRFPL